MIVPIESYCQSTYPCLDSSDVAKINRAFNKASYCDSVLYRYEIGLYKKDSIILLQGYNIQNYKELIDLKDSAIRKERKAKRRNKFYLLIGIVAGLLISI